MRGINKVILLGNLGKEPEMQILEGNIAVAKFSLATSDAFKDRNGNLVSQTEWHTIVLWRGLAELAQKFLHKGSMVYIEGRLKTRSWEDKEGNKKFATEIVGDQLIMLDKRTDTESFSDNKTAEQGLKPFKDSSSENYLSNLLGNS
jgi:single-strand DNA-binding protein